MSIGRLSGVGALSVGLWLPRARARVCVCVWRLSAVVVVVVVGAAVLRLRADRSAGWAVAALSWCGVSLWQILWGLSEVNRSYRS